MIVILSGISGVGKTTIAKLLEEQENFTRSISYTSRNKRHAEQHGKDYMFVKKEDFQNKIRENFFLEYTEQFDNFYGTAYQSIQALLDADRHVVMCLSKEGYAAALNAWPDKVLGIYLMPPSVDELTNRLCDRNSDDLYARIEDVRKKSECADDHSAGYHHKIMPSSIENTLQEVLNACKAFRR